MAKLQGFGIKHILIIALACIFLLYVAAFFSDRTLLFLFKDKIRAHKTNNIAQLKKAKQVFSGVELDVVFFSSKNDFDVNHPPDKSIGLWLTKYFRSQEKPADFNYWLDFKNLDGNNEVQSANKLDSISSLFKINNSNIIVESIHPEFLNSFLNKGFLTSYYLPAGLNALDPDSLNVVLKKISGNIVSFGNLYISAEYLDYPILKKYFPDTKKLIWFSTYGSMKKVSARILLYEILLDKNVDVLLIPFES